MAKKYRRQWVYTLEQTQQYVEHPKVLADSEVPEWKVSKRGNPQHVTRQIDLRMKDMPFQPTEQQYHAHGLKSNKYNYACALVIDGERIRGIDYCEATQTRFFNKNTAIVPGWHENICYFSPDENKVVNDHVKEGFETFDPADLDDFFKLTTQHWNILIPERKENLL